MPGKTRHIAVTAIGRMLLLLAALAFPAVASAEDVDVAALMERYAAVTAEAEELLSIPLDRCVSRRYAPEAHSRIISPRGNAAVAVGGDFRAAYAAVRSKTMRPGANDPFVLVRDMEKARTGDLFLGGASLFVDAMIGDRWRARFEFNLNGHYGPNRIRERRNPNAPGGQERDYPYAPGADDANLGEVYLRYLKAGHSGFGFKIGRFRLPFGLRGRRERFVQSYLDAPDFAGSYLLHPFAWDASPRLPHASRFIDPSYAAMATYEMRDVIQFYAAAFIDDPERDGRGVGARGGRFRSDDPGLRSFLVGVTALPLEDWELSLGFRNRYNRNRGIGYWANSPYRMDFLENRAAGRRDPRWDATSGQWSDAGTGPGFGSTRNEQAFFAAAALEIPNTKLAVALEYAHGWNQGFNKYVSSDSLDLELTYRMLRRLTLIGEAGWLRVRDRASMVEVASGDWRRDARRNDLYRLHLGFEYELMDGLTLEGGWQYEYWRLRSRKAKAGKSDNFFLDAAMFYMGTRFIF
ncbi:MAG: hypothetical protein LBJ46_03355 [Planctomycetota bacterium]|nr:hypothetical protein [Planctomycetota bacterium]